MQETLSLFGQEVEDAAEETFDLFSQATSTGDLGMLDPKAATLDLTIRGRDFTLTQSPGLLQSDREGGTTGAAVWATSVRVAQWIADPENVLFKQKVLRETSSVLELGSGISGVVGCVLAPRVERLVLTDQQYTLKLLKENVAANTLTANTPKSKKQAKGSSSHHKDASSNIVIEPLDWETDSIAPFLSLNGLTTGVDVVLACDCIYNYALIEPFTQACADICRVRQQAPELDGSQPTVCVVAQHLRQPDVFEEWAEVFLRTFRTWRIPSELLGEALGEGSGFSVHIAVLK